MNTQYYSVLMSVYQKEKPEFLRQSMQSIYDQTIPTDDFVLVCDGPLTDELDSVIEEMQEKFGERLRVIRQANNRGLGYSLNSGITECKNELIARMDSDDISTSDRIEKQLKVFSEKNVDIVGSSIIEYDERMEKIFGKRAVPENDREIKKYAKKRNPMNHVSVIFKKSSVLEAGNYENILGFEDYYLWIKMMKKNCNFYNMQESLVKVRGGESMTGRRGGMRYIKNMLEFEKEIYGKQFISWMDYVSNVTIRVLASLAPNNIRAFFYCKVLRKGGL